MWQRFSENARKVVHFAQEEAQKLGEGYISTEHLLLGLTREECAASRVLLSLRLEPSFLRAEVFRNVPRNESLQDSDISLTPRGKRVIDLAYDEARLLNDDFIGTEHLLLGLVREEAGLAGRILKKAGLNVDRTREAVVTVRGGEPPAPRARPQRPLQRIKHSFGLHDRQDAAFSMFLSLQPTARTCLLVLAVMALLLWFAADRAGRAMARWQPESLASAFGGTA